MLNKDTQCIQPIQYCSWISASFSIRVFSFLGYKWLPWNCLNYFSWKISGRPKATSSGSYFLGFVLLPPIQQSLKSKEYDLIEKPGWRREDVLTESQHCHSWVCNFGQDSGLWLSHFLILKYRVIPIYSTSKGCGGKWKTFVNCKALNKRFPGVSWSSCQEVNSDFQIPLRNDLQNALHSAWLLLVWGFAEVLWSLTTPNTKALLAPPLFLVVNKLVSVCSIRHSSYLAGQIEHGVHWSLGQNYAPEPAGDIFCLSLPGWWSGIALHLLLSTPLPPLALLEGNRSQPWLPQCLHRCFCWLGCYNLRSHGYRASYRTPVCPVLTAQEWAGNVALPNSFLKLPSLGAFVSCGASGDFTWPCPQPSQSLELGLRPAFLPSVSSTSGSLSSLLTFCHPERQFSWISLFMETPHPVSQTRL